MPDDLQKSIESEYYGPENVQVLGKMPETFYGLLDAIREWPVMFLGRKSLQVFDSWLLGYRYAKREIQRALSADEEEFRDFDDFVCQKYRWHDSGGWAAKIAYHHRDDAAALDAFFKLLDEFRESKRRT
jgi:hypothetical protein